MGGKVKVRLGRKERVGRDWEGRRRVGGGEEQ